LKILLVRVSTNITGPSGPKTSAAAAFSPFPSVFVREKVPLKTARNLE